MVYQKRRNGFKRTFKRKPRYTSKGKMYSLQKQIRTVARMARPELKYTDVSVSNPPTPVAATGYISAPINAIVQGTDDDERIGREITLKSIQLRANPSMVLNSADAGNATFVLFIDHQPQAGTPAWSDLFTSPSTTSFRNLDNAKRFTILKSTRKSFEVGVSGSDVLPTTSTNQMINWYVKLRCKTRFDQAGTPTTNVIRAAYIFQAVEPISWGTNEIRLRYTDA